jgi:CHASE2 domain-containing sensor protein
MLRSQLTIKLDTTEAIQGIADAVDPEPLVMAYPEAAGAIINQHGFNLLWIGAVTTVCAAFLWRRSTPAIFLAAMVAGLADIGYFLFLDLGGYVNFVPGTVMTLICASAITLSFFARFRSRSSLA